MANRKVLLCCVSFIIIFSNIHFITVQAKALPSGKMKNIGPPINTHVDDFSPSITADGKTIVFNSKRGGRCQNIYISHLKDGKWSNPRYMYELNSRFSDESPYITPDGAFIFFSSDRDGSIEMPANRLGQIRVSFDLYISKNVNGRWDSPIKAPGNVNSAHHERSPSLSLDSKTLFYSSWPFGDVRQARVMKADYSDGTFKNPAPLPAPVNVNAQDTGFVPSLDGKGYYFSSTRAGGCGGWDIYYISYKNGRFGNPVNLGQGINSKMNEIYLSLVGKTMYFCSNREGGYGKYDIYTSGIPKQADDLKIVVRDKKTKKPLPVEMRLSTKVKEDDERTTTYEIKKKTDENGEAIVKHKPRVKNLDVIINEEGYLPLFNTIDIPQTKGKPQILELVPIEKEASFDIHSIHFDFESSRIKPESYPYLNALADYLKKYSSLRFEIIGHTDLHGTDEFNNKLSLDRAQAVKNYLAGRDLDEKRFAISGAGKTRPIIPQLGPGIDEKNRRTEFKLLEK